jgi:O-methyltransferase involved in polyketide biosynthesis
MYITREATMGTLRQIAALAPGSTVAMTFLKPVNLVEPDEQAMHQATDKAARASGTPFISYYSPQDMVTMAQDAGFSSARCVTAADLADRYFADRTDAVRPASAEELLLATT